MTSRRGKCQHQFEPGLNCGRMATFSIFGSWTQMLDNRAIDDLIKYKRVHCNIGTECCAQHLVGEVRRINAVATKKGHYGPVSVNVRTIPAWPES